MSKGEDKDELLLLLERSATPVAELTSYSTEPGIYGFFLLKGSLRIGQRKFAAPGTLLYVGKTKSSQKARDAGEHLADGQTGRSTLRRSLGALLREQLSLKPRPRSDSEKSTRRFTNFKFDSRGEKELTNWMRKHLSVGFCKLATADIPGREKDLISSAIPPLNIENNSKSPYRGELELVRAQCSCMALEWEQNRPKDASR